VRYYRFALIVAAPVLLCADSITIDFETFPDSSSIIDNTPITTQFPGLSFTNTTVITSGISLNELELPPHSGNNVAFDDSGPISIDFDTPVLSFSGHFTYYVPLTIAAFDSPGDEVASADSAYSSNVACGDGPPCLGDPGSSPNELISVDFANGISSVTITGGPSGSSFAMDDIGYTALSSLPEPTSAFLMAVGCMFIALKLISK
jgi:hypothetical protein